MAELRRTPGSGDAAAARGWRWRRVVYAAVSVGVTVGVMGVLLARHPPREILRAILEMDRRGVACFIILSLGQSVFRLWRYQTLLRSVGERVGNAAMFLTTLIRNLFSDLLPARIGTLSYVYVVTQRLGVPLEAAASSFAVVFVFDLIAVAPMILVALLFVGSEVGLSTKALAALAAGSLVVLVAALWLLPQMLALVGWVLRRVQRPACERAAARLDAAAAQVRATRRAGLYLRLLVLSMLVRACKYGGIYFLVFALLQPYGYALRDLSVPRVFLGMSAAELAASTPVSGVAGFGAYEGVWKMAFRALGFPAHLAGETAVAAHLLMQLWGYGLGAAAMVVILLPVFGRRRQPAPHAARRPGGSLAFSAKAAAVVMVFAALVVGAYKSDLLFSTSAPPAGEVPTAEELAARAAIARDLKGRILFDSNRSGTFGIWTMRPDGHDVRSVVDTAAQEMYPSASPDGEWIAYARSDRLGPKAESEVWLVRADGEGARLLVQNATFPSWSAGGAQVYFERDRATLMVVSVDGGEPEELLPKSVPGWGNWQIVKPRVSSDGRRAAFITDREGRWSVWTADIQTGEPRRVGPGCEPAWFPDGKRLVWIGRGQSKTALWRYDTGDGSRKVLHDGGAPRGQEYFPTVSPDGRYVFFSAAPDGPARHENANYQIYLLPLDGRPAVRLTFDLHTNRWASLLPVQQ